SFQFYAHHRQSAALVDFNLVFHHFTEAADDRLQGARIKVVTANMQHIVASAQDAVLQADEDSAAGARAGIDSDAVSGAITNERTSPPPEIGEQQLADFTNRNALPRFAIHYFYQAFA